MAIPSIVGYGAIVFQAPCVVLSYTTTYVTREQATGVMVTAFGQGLPIAFCLGG